MLTNNYFGQGADANISPNFFCPPLKKFSASPQIDSGHASEFPVTKVYALFFDNCNFCLVVFTSRQGLDVVEMVYYNYEVIDR